MAIGAWAAPERVVAVLLLAVSGCGGGDPAASDTDGTSAPAADDTASDTGAMGPTSDAETTGAEPGASGPLVDLAAWLAVDPEADPWAAERPDDAVCDAGHVYEDMVFEVDTEICTFGTFVQPSLLPVRAGDEIELILLHDNLYSAEGDAEAHVAVGLGGEPIWETAIPIPMLQSLVRPTFTAPADAPAGTPVHFHVHNHGYNNYRMIGLSVL